jgi:hypothetical protein
VRLGQTFFFSNKVSCYRSKEYNVPKYSLQSKKKWRDGKASFSKLRRRCLSDWLSSSNGPVSTRRNTLSNHGNSRSHSQHLDTNKVMFWTIIAISDPSYSPTHSYPYNFAPASLQILSTHSISPTSLTLTYAYERNPTPSYTPSHTPSSHSPSPNLLLPPSTHGPGLGTTPPHSSS